MLTIRSSRTLTKGLRTSPRPLWAASQRFSECGTLSERRPHVGSCESAQLLCGETNDPNTSKDNAALNLVSTHSRQTERRPRPKIPGLTIRAHLDIKRQKYVARFNNCLREASRALYADHEREQLWQAYRDLKQHAADAVNIIPDVAWKRMWKMQSTCRPEDSERLTNLQTLLADMEDVGLDTRTEREVLRLEMNIADGRPNEVLREWTQGSNGHLPLNLTEVGLGEQSVIDHESAIRQWERGLEQSQAQKGVYKGFSKEWLELGIRLHATAGKLNRAREILHIVGRRFHNSDPRFIVFLIQQLSTTGHEADIQRAWTHFLSLLQQSKFTMTVDDYELIFFSFFKHKPALPMAALVLSSMIKQHGKVLEHQSRIFGGLVRKLQNSCTTPDQIDAVSLAILDQIPDGLPSDLFYTTWIESTGRHGDPSRIAEIIELIFEQGRNPHPWHINTLLKVWFNAEGGRKARNAESLALEMIKKRTESDLAYSSLGSFVQNTARMLRIPKFLRRQLPAAGVHTYVQLMGHYAKKGDVDSAQHVLKLLTQSSTLKLNGHMIRAILSIHFMMKDTGGAWEFFNHVLQDEFVQVDLRTYGVLWKGLHLNLSLNKTSSLENYPTPRKLFRHMLKHLVLSNPDSEIPFQQKPPATLYDRIIRCFCLAEDSVGALLALHGMKDIFGQTPTRKTIECLVQHIAHREAWRNRKRTDRRPAEDYVLGTTEILEFLYAHLYPSGRALRGSSRSVTNRLCSPEFSETRGEDLLDVLSAFLRDYTSARSRTATKFKRGFNNAREDMGLGILLRDFANTGHRIGFGT